MENINKKRVIPILIGVFGIVLILFSGIFSDKKSASVTIDDSDEDISAYTKLLEEKICAICEACDGVSNVTVMVTLEGGFEYEYAKNIDIGNGSYGSDRKEEYLIIGQGSGQKCVLIRKKQPSVAGVGIVCKGGGSDTVKSELMTLISSALGIGASKIYITEAS